MRNHTYNSLYLAIVWRHFKSVSWTTRTLHSRIFKAGLREYFLILVFPIRISIKLFFGFLLVFFKPWTNILWFFSEFRKERQCWKLIAKNAVKTKNFQEKEGIVSNWNIVTNHKIVNCAHSVDFIWTEWKVALSDITRRTDNIFFLNFTLGFQFFEWAALVNTITKKKKKIILNHSVNHSFRNGTRTKKSSEAIWI